MRILFLLISYLFVLMSVSAGPEPVRPLSRAMLSIDHYQAQLPLWQAEARVNPENEYAWLYYYTSARNVNILQGRVVHDLSGIVREVGEALPGSFTFHYLKYWQSDVFSRDYEALLKAHAADPERTEVFHDLMHYHAIQGDLVGFQTWCQRYFETGELSPGVLNWNYNALASVREGGVLITQGDNDTYPGWVLQEMRGVRTDVLIANLYLLLAEREYRSRIFADLRIPDNFQRPTEATIHAQAEALLQHITTYCERPVHLGIATPTAQRQALESRLYVTGLAFAYSKQYLDNVRLLRFNYENDFLLQPVKAPLYYDSAQSVVDNMNMNYLPALAILHEMYQEEGAEKEAQAVADLGLTIARRQEEEAAVAEMFNPPVSTAIAVATNMDLRALDKALRPVQDNLHASVYEVSNDDYQRFLEDLLAAKRFDLLEVCKTQATDWRSLLPEPYQNLPLAVLYEEAGNPEAGNHPVVNISHAAAQAYCDWLTAMYNASDHRRKRFQEVRFRLPTVAEWEKAALGKWTYPAPYPWGGPYNRNAKGCYLANFNPYFELEEEDGEVMMVPTGESPDEDGAYFTAPIDAYHPNNTGFFNLSGNAREMTQEEGVTKGGGWLDPTYFTQISTTNANELPNANTGFRVFMEVVR